MPVLKNLMIDYIYGKLKVSKLMNLENKAMYLLEQKRDVLYMIAYVQWTLVIVKSVLSPILFTNERCSLFSM